MRRISQKFFAVLMALVMVVGMLPVSAFAATGEVIDAAIFCSDVHGSTSDLTSVLNGVKTSGVDYSSIGFVGDTCLTVANTTSIVQSALGDTDISVMFSYAASHDAKDGADISDKWDYSGEVEGVSANYLVYTIRETDMQNDNGAEAGFTSWYNGLTAAEKQLPIFIMSHRPLHDRRDDNAGAAAWYDAISDAAESSDIVFFWAHNHTGETSVDTAAYYVAKNGSESITVYKGETVIPNFTYMNAGYINANNQDPARLGVATTVQITADSLIFQDYNSSGAYSGTYAHNTTVAREFAGSSETVTKTLSSIAVTTAPTTTTYNVGDTFSAEGLVVTATYSDGTTAVVTPTSVSAPDMTTAGTKTVTVTYTEGDVTQTATFEITVSAAGGGEDVTPPTGDDEDDSNSVTLGGKVTSTEKKTVYVLTSSISSGNSYLIVNGNSAGSYYALANNSGSVAATGVTVKTDSTIGTYIELTDATDELWAVSSGYKFANQSKYLYRASNSGNTPRIDSSSTNWSYSTNHRLSYTRDDRTYYLYYSSGWKVSSSSSNASSIYFYVPTEVDVETTVDTEVTYTMRAENLTKVVTDTSKTAALSYCLQGNGTDLTTLPSGGSYSFTVLSDESGIISSIDANGTVTFTGTEGSAKVKVAYTWTQDGQEYTVYKNVTVTASEPYYSIGITKGDTLVTGTTIAEKGVTNETTLQLGTQIKLFDGDPAAGEVVEIPEGATLEWSIPEEYQNIATVDQNGLVTFKGVDGAFYVMVTLTVNGKDYTAGVNISASTSAYANPNDGTNDFPEYPNEGAIRFDKTATAVGNFSETGIAQVELSMTGVPYTTGSEIDVVIMLDQSTSMGDTRIAATVAATKAFINSIVINEDGTYNSNRIYVGYFNGSKTYDITDSANIGGDLASIDSKTELDALFSDIDSEFDGSPSTSGTEYGVALEKCYTRLNTAKTDGTGNDRQQFCVFMSDGVPTTLQVGESSMLGTSGDTQDGFSDMKGMFTGTDYDTRSSSYQYEYYSTQMKANGVTVYTVGLGLEAKNNAWSSASATQCLNAASLLLNDIAGPAKETTKDTGSTLSKKDSYFFSVEDADAVADMTNVFSNIAQKILQAATDITVEDKIADKYTMIFDIPTDTNYNHTISTSQEFYIEFVKYTLDENHERTDSGTSVTKLYLIDSNGDNAGGTYSAGSSATTAYDAPVFEQKVIGEKGTLYYWTTDSTYATKAAVSYASGSTTYYFIPYGIKATDDDYDATKWFNMTSGAYASGTVNSVTNTSTDLVIATPYFVYNASTKMLYWTVDKLDTTEYALRYFLYLDNSATDIGENTETPAGPYPTNDHAYITYTNFRGNDCQQKFPVPQLTWNGAQVSYVFYLVNAAGQPINKSGQVVDFANATFVTDVFTEHVVWNDAATPETEEGVAYLDAQYKAQELLPSDYMLYDLNSYYELYVYEDHEGTALNNYFKIDGSAAAEISSSLNDRLELNTSSTTVSLETTKVYITKAGTKYAAYGTYDESKVYTGFDFASTTVAFAVVWQPKLVPDVVVVDYGLDVLINVVENDLMQNIVSGIGTGNAAYGNTAINTGVSTESKLGTAALTIEDNTISIENENQVRFHQGDMQFKDAVTFYYESPVEFYENSDKQEGYMYSSVTVIPATTIYYEDEFLTLESYTVTTNDDGTSTSAKDTTSKWTTAGTASNETQAQDRPGASQISADLDADNVYGYDAAYEDMSTYSMGSAAKISVDAATRGEATFTFYGTGFDVISMTSNMTGTIIVQVYSGASATGTAAKSSVVDTYYGYTQNEDGEWVTSVNDPNALYQVPVMKMSGLTYGQYTVKIVAGYNDYFNHTATEGGYDLYLDAIRIYDPAGVAGGSVTNTTIQDAYKADKEAWPQYIELRNNIIAASNYTVTENEDGTVTISGTNLSGAIFIDSSDATTSITDYVSYGPNNELYLKKGQSVAFALDQTYASIIADVQVAVKLGNGSSAAYEIYNAAIDGTKSNVKTGTLTAATDLYYSIKDLASGTIVISNTGDGILSITNIKVTYTQNPYGTASSSGENLDDGIMTTSLYADEEVATAAVMSLRSAPVVDEPETPEEPETPVKPDEPDEPVTPDEPETPVEPDEPEAPEEPEIPDAEQVVTTILKKVINTIKSLLGWLFK